MRSVVAIGLVLLAVARGAAVYADPSTPQINPRHGQREDAQRLREQLRGLDRETPAEPVAFPSSQPRTDVDPARGNGSTAAHDKPLSQRWWFWAAIGAVAVGAIGLLYGANDTARTSQPPLPGVTCDATGCRP